MTYIAFLVGKTVVNWIHTEDLFWELVPNQSKKSLYQWTLAPCWCFSILTLIMLREGPGGEWMGRKWERLRERDGGEGGSILAHLAQLVTWHNLPAEGLGYVVFLVSMMGNRASNLYALYGAHKDNFIGHGSSNAFEILKKILTMSIVIYPYLVTLMCMSLCQIHCIHFLFKFT